MKLNLIDEKAAPLLSRKRLKFEIDYSGGKTPSRADVRKMIAAAQKVKEDLVVIRHIYPKFGKSLAKVIVHLYDTVEDLKKYEVVIKDIKEKEKKEEANSAAPQEAPKEEKKEEAKKEETAKPEGETNAKEESKE